MSSFEVTLDNCDSEPIHIPNLIQPDGFLLAIDTGSWQIIQTSVNAAEILGVSKSSLLEQPLSNLFSGAVSELRSLDFTSFPVVFDAFNIRLNSYNFICVPHCCQQDVLILEFEFDRDAASSSSQRFFRILNNSILNIQKLDTFDKLASYAAKAIKTLTGYDRVMVYKFDREYNGDVIAEEKAENLNSFLHHKFPASDIPPQARALYLKNWVRMISDIDYKPVALHPQINAVTGDYLDLSHCFLRSVSPIHIEYLQNMNVKATLTISIVADGRLWGLVACHHYESKHLSYDYRVGIEFLGKVLSSAWQKLENDKIRASKMTLMETTRSLFADLSITPDMPSVLVKNQQDLLAITAADGLLITFGSEKVRLGKVPDEPFVESLLPWLNQSFGEQTFYTNCLRDEMTCTAVPDTASGILSIALQQVASYRLIWFRGECSQSIDWGGNPYEKHLTQLEENHFRLSPRKSFEKWTEAVKYHSADWEIHQLEAAKAFKNSFAEMLAWQHEMYKHQKEHLQAEVIKKTTEVSTLYDQLLVQYTKLEKIAYEQSHIVRGPLSTVMGLTSLLQHETDPDEVNLLHRFLQTKVNELDNVIRTIVSHIEKR